MFHLAESQVKFNRLTSNKKVISSVKTSARVDISSRTQLPQKLKSKTKSLHFFFYLELKSLGG